MNYLESIYQQYGSKVGIQPLEIVANDVNGLYVFPDGNDLLRKCQLLAVTARAVSGTLYSPLNESFLSVSQAATVMSGQSGKSFLLHFYGLFY